jgi:hypothetical protein
VGQVLSRLPVAGYDARRFWKTVERGKVPVGISVNYLETVPSHVRNENAAALGFESSMVKRSTR